eukprot:1915000-Pleurochrysis_carterae.AAC.1
MSIDFMRRRLLRGTNTGVCSGCCDRNHALRSNVDERVGDLHSELRDVDVLAVARRATHCGEAFLPWRAAVGVGERHAVAVAQVAEGGGVLVGLDARPGVLLQHEPR